jgi:hypothetical protein
MPDNNKFLLSEFCKVIPILDEDLQRNSQQERQEEVLEVRDMWWSFCPAQVRVSVVG